MNVLCPLDLFFFYIKLTNSWSKSILHSISWNFPLPHDLCRRFDRSFTDPTHLVNPKWKFHCTINVLRQYSGGAFWPWNIARILPHLRQEDLPKELFPLLSNHVWPKLVSSGFDGAKERLKAMDFTNETEIEPESAQTKKGCVTVACVLKALSFEILEVYVLRTWFTCIIPGWRNFIYLLKKYFSSAGSNYFEFIYR